MYCIVPQPLKEYLISSPLLIISYKNESEESFQLHGAIIFGYQIAKHQKAVPEGTKHMYDLRLAVLSCENRGWNMCCIKSVVVVSD